MVAVNFFCGFCSDFAESSRRNFARFGFDFRAHSARTAKKIIANRSDVRCTVTHILQRLRDLERRRFSFFCAVLRAFRDDFIKFYAELSRNFAVMKKYPFGYNILEKYPSNIQKYPNILYP